MGRNRATSNASTRSSEAPARVGKEEPARNEHMLSVYRSWEACMTTWPR